MTIFVRGQQVFGNAEQVAVLLEALASDLRRIGTLAGPSQDDLATAPLLESWYHAVRVRPCLSGLVTGHPSLSGPRVFTSEVFALSPDANWARTLSRYYRLGAMHPDKAAPRGFLVVPG